MFGTNCATLLSMALFLSFIGNTPSHAAASDFIPSTFTKLENPRDLPPAIITSVDGQKTPFSKLIGMKHGTTPLFLHIWDPKCLPCVAEMKNLDNSITEINGLGMGVLIVTEDPDGQYSVPAFLRRYSINRLKPYIDPNRAIEIALAPKGLPVTYALSIDGKIIAEHLGPVDWAALARR